MGRIVIIRKFALVPSSSSSFSSSTNNLEKEDDNRRKDYNDNDNKEKELSKESTRDYIRKNERIHYIDD